MQRKNRKYVTVEKQTPEGLLFGIQLQEPEKWKGTIISFTDGRIGEKDSTNVAEVKFNFDVLSNPHQLSEDELSSKEFSKLLGDIFVEICEYILAPPVAK